MADKNNPIGKFDNYWAIGLGALILVVVFLAYNSANKSNSSVSTTPQLTNDQSSQIQELQNQIDQLKKQKPQTIIKEVPAKTPISTPVATPQNLAIDAPDVSSFVTGIVQIMCFGTDYTSYGSGSLWNISGLGYAVVTNRHVIGSFKKCSALVNDDIKHVGGLYNLDTGNIRAWNQDTDLNILPIAGKAVPGQGSLADLNYQISSLRICPNQIAQGSPVIVIGYPVSGRMSVTTQEYGSSFEWNRIVTNGIISGYDSSVIQPVLGGNLPYSNYFVSNQIDSGNSGGIAISKDSSGLCLLGIPTWVNVGNYSNQGVVQNINNILYKW